jgi:protein TonB
MAASALYSPYGAYELKSKYQRNFMFGTLITASVFIVIVATTWIIAAIPGDDVHGGMANVTVIETVADLGPPPSIVQKPPQVKVDAPKAAAPKVGIPKPVADDEVLDDDVVLATRDELADIVAPDIVSSTDNEIIIDIDDDDYLPAPDEFVPVEINAEMIYMFHPEYPRFAKNAGLGGTVWVRCLVGKNGNVLKSMLGKTCGTPSLDEAAVQAAFQNKFKPGIQNGRPVACWVTYKFEWVIED